MGQMGHLLGQGCVGLPRISNFVSLGLRHTIATATLKAAKWSPAVVHDAIANIKSLEVAIELLGLAPLVIGFRAAQERSKVGRQFIESRNVLRANEIVARVVEQKAIFKAEVAQAKLLQLPL